MFNLSPTSFDPTNALCTEVDPELFFPEPNKPGYTEQVKLAKQVCFNCPIIAECLQEALTNAHSLGIWGGTTEKERVEIRKKKLWKQGTIITKGD